MKPNAILEHLTTLASGNMEARSRLPTALAEYLEIDTPRPEIEPKLADLLVRALASTTRNQQRLLSDALQTLANPASEIDRALREALRSEASDFAWGAAYTLGKRNPITKEIWPIVRAMMGEDDGDSRWAAAEIACAMANQLPDIAQALREACTDPNPTHRRMALYFHRDLRAPDLYELAGANLADPMPHGRLASLAALATIPSSEIPVESQASLARALLQVLEYDVDPGVQRAAAACIGKIQLAGTRESLITAAASPDTGMARAASRALEKW